MKSVAPGWTLEHRGRKATPRGQLSGGAGGSSRIALGPQVPPPLHCIVLPLVPDGPQREGRRGELGKPCKAVATSTLDGQDVFLLSARHPPGSPGAMAATLEEDPGLQDGDPMVCAPWKLLLRELLLLEPAPDSNLFFLSQSAC